MAVLVPLLRQYLHPYRWPILLICVFQLIQTTASLYLPGLNADIIDDGVAKGDTAVIWHVGGLMVAVTLVQVACNIVAVYVGSKVAMSVGRDLRAGVFDKVETFGAREMGEFGAPTLITRSTNDVQQVQLLLFMALTMLVAAPMTGIGGLILALREDVAMSSLLLVILPVLMVSLALIIRQMRPLFRLMQTRIDSINGIMREQITGIRVIRAFVKEDQEKLRFGEANDVYRDTAIAAGRLMSLFFPLLMGVMNLSVIAVLWWGAHRIDAGTLQIGAMTAFQQYLMQILMAIMMATFMFMLWPRSEVSAERITEVLETLPDIDLDAAVAPVALTSGRLELQGASFRFPGAEADIIHDVSATIVPGKTTAIVGSTGSGKTTLLRLLVRLLDATDGAVCIDGHNVKDLRPDDVWTTCGVVPQKAFLFSGTIGSNLRYGKADATDEEMWRALEVAQAADFVRRLPDGLDSVVAQGGQNFSGGQRQRLAIARALVRQPLVYLFDDSFSALDFATDAALRAALRAETRDAAVVIVAQRISTIRDAEQILVLDEGRVVGAGRHGELMESCAVYREIVLSQLTEEEAA